LFYLCPWKIISIGNKTIEANQPWAKIKQDSGKEEVEALLGFVANVLIKTALLLSPVMPKSMQKLSLSLKSETNSNNYQKYIKNEEFLEDFIIEKIPPLFPKIENLLMPEQTEQQETKDEVFGVITIDEFFKTEIKIGTIIEANELKKSKKLLVLKVDIAENSPRQVVAGIKEYYSSEELINTQVCLVSNLKPAKLMGVESQGMILAAKDKDGLSLIRPSRQTEVGSKVS
jgi:methionyl-tRNA synthetase